MTTSVSCSPFRVSNLIHSDDLISFPVKERAIETSSGFPEAVPIYNNPADVRVSDLPNSDDLISSPVKKRAIETSSGSPEAVPIYNNPADSPQKVKTPMKYHTFDGVMDERQKILKGFKNKKKHTLAPDSAEKQFRPLQRNYAELKKAKKQLQFEGESVQLESAEALFVVKKDEIIVSAEGKKRSFGIHQTTLSDGTKQDRAYPKDGDGVVTLRGDKVLELIAAFKGADHPCNFRDFVVAQVKDHSESEDIKPDSSDKLYV